MKDKVFKPEVKISLKNLKSSSETQAISYLERLKTDEGWRLVKEAIQLNLEWVEDQILEGGDEKQLDLYREQRRCYLELLNTPDHLISKIKGSDLPDKDLNLDPYDQPENLTPEIE